MAVALKASPGMHSETPSHSSINQSMTADVVRGLESLARACRILEMEGHGDMSLGHLSWRDPQARGFWMKRNRIGLGEVLGVQDFVLIDFEGCKLLGEGGCHSEWPIHSEILRNRPEVMMVAHTHPLHAGVLSGAPQPIEPFMLDADYLDALPFHADPLALIVTRDEGQALAQSLGTAYAVLIGNHGVAFCGRSIEHGTCVGVFLEKAARAHLLGLSAGLRARALSAPVRARRHAQVMTPVHVEHSWNYFNRKLDALAAERGAVALYR